MTSIYSLPQKRAASGETLLTNSTKRAPRALAPRGTTKGAHGLRVQLGNGLRAPRRRPTSVLTTCKRYTTVSCIEGRRHAGGELGNVSKVGVDDGHELVDEPRLGDAGTGAHQMLNCFADVPTVEDGVSVPARRLVHIAGVFR